MKNITGAWSVAAALGFAISLTLSLAPATVRAAAPRCGAGSSVVSSPSPGPIGNHLSGVISLSHSDGWAVGAATSTVGDPPVLRSDPLMLHWDGDSWATAVTPALIDGGALSSITAPSRNRLWAVGHQGPLDAGTPLIERWSGSSWSVVPSPVVDMGYLLSVSAHRANDVWAVGIIIGQVSYTLIEHWNGASWSVIPSPNPSADYNELDSVATLPDGTAWAVGQFLSSTFATSPLLARWDGSRWSLVDAPATTFSNNLLRSVAAGGSRDVWAVGQSASDDGSMISPLALHWNGRKWAVESVAVPTPQSWFTAVAVKGDRVWAVGARVDGFTRHTLVETTDRWNLRTGDRWNLRSVPSGNRGAGDNWLEAVAPIGEDGAWAVGGDMGVLNGETLVVRQCH